jgi:hypothetical protein
MGMGMKFLRYDDAEYGDLYKDATTNFTPPYLFNQTNWGTNPWKEKKSPGNSNTVAIVTGHKYRVSWGKTGLDFENLNAGLDEHWLETDKSVYFVHNFTDVRAKIEIKLDGQLIENDTIPANPSDYTTGQNLVRNITDVQSNEEQLLKFVVNGKNSTPYKSRMLTFKGYRCIGPCNVDINETTEVGAEKLWSDPNSWPDGKIPGEGDNVHIESGWNMTMDVANGT